MYLGTGVIGKPDTFDPEPHTHSGNDVLSQVANADTCAEVPWSGVLDKPSFSLDTHGHPLPQHTHAAADIDTNNGSDLIAWAKVDAPATLPPSSHRHNFGDINNFSSYLREVPAGQSLVNQGPFTYCALATGVDCSLTYPYHQHWTLTSTGSTACKMLLLLSGRFRSPQYGRQRCIS